MEIWTDEQQVEYEFARDTISSLSALLSRYTYWRELLGKAKTKKEINYLARVNERSIELAKEMKLFDGFDTDIIQDIINKYSPLIKEYHDTFDSDETAGEKELDKRYLLTKVLYSE